MLDQNEVLRVIEDLKRRVRLLRQETLVLYLAARHPDTPWYARALAAAVTAYALSPIDLIPDFIPVLGYLDDLLIVPAGIALAIRLVPQPVMEQCRAQAGEVFAQGRPVSRAAAVAVIITWMLGAAVLLAIAWRVFWE